MLIVRNNSDYFRQKIHRARFKVIKGGLNLKINTGRNSNFITDRKP